MTRLCKYCGGPLRLTPIGNPRTLLFVHTESRTAGQRCRASRMVFGQRLMDRRQLMLPGMEWQMTKKIA